MKKRILPKGILVLVISLIFSSLIFAGPNENAGIVFDLDATTYGNQNLTGIPSQPAGTYIRLDVYCTEVHNLDTYEFEVIYDPTELVYVGATAINLITFEPNILTTNGGEALGWMIYSSTPGVLSLAYTLAGTDTLEAPEGEGLIADIVFQALVATHGTLSFGYVLFIDSFGEGDVITNKGVAILYEFGNIDGTVTNSNTVEPINGAIVSIGDFSDTTGTDGTYLLEYIPIGIHDITCTAEGYYDTVDVVEVLEDQTVTVDFVLEPFPRGTLDGTVTDANNGEPIEDALITATSQGKVEYTGFTNADGYYIIDSLLASEIVGNYIVICDAGVPYTLGEVTDVEIIEDETTTIDFVLAAPIMVVDPLEIFPIVENMGDSTITDITLSNIGTAPFDWNAGIEYPDAITLDFTTNRFEGVTDPSMNAEVDPNQTTPYNPPTRDLWDILFAYDVDTPTGLTGLVSAETDGSYLYTTKWTAGSNQIAKFDLEGNFIEIFSIPGVTRLRDLAYDGTYFYGSNTGYYIWEMDFDTQTLVSTIPCPVDVRSIAYDEYNDAFWVNNFSSDLKLVDRSGNVLNTIFAPPSLYGTAYDNITPGGPYLWIFTGTSLGAGCQVEQYNLNTLTLTGVTHSVSGDFPGTIAGGLFTSGDIVPGIWVLGGLAQGTPDILFAYELGPYLDWLSVEPNSGTVEPGDDEIVQATAHWLEAFFPGQVKYTDIVFTPDPNCLGEQTVNVMATFGPAIPGSISGLVTLENTPYGSGNVEDVLLTAVSQVFPSSYYTAYPDSTGEYTIQSVYPGTYDVTASLLYDYEDSTIVDVEVEEATNTPNIDFELNCLLGALQGTVTDGYGEPIEGATITAIGDLPPLEPYCVTTNDTGYYEIDPIIGQFYNFTCEAEGFVTFTDTFTVLPGETYVEDVIMGNPILRVEPDSYEVTLAPETQTTRLITVYNDGNAPLSWTADIQFPDRQVINIPPATTDFPRSEDKLSLSLAPQNGEPINSSTTPMINPLRGTTAYAFNVMPGSDLVTFDTDAPETWLTTIPMTYTPFAADFDIDDNFYAIDYNNNNLYAVDIETGVFTFIGPTQTSTDLACDKIDGTMYAASYYGSNSYLYTIDLTTGSATLIGLINAGIIISMACDGEGNLWGFDILDDALYAIDKDDGHGTYVGSVGFDGNYAQSMAWDPESDIVYMAAYNNTVGAGQLRIVDTSTGATALVGNFNGGAEVAGLGFQGGVWLNIDPTSGYVLPGEYEEVTATFDATGQTVGTVLTANIHFIPNVGEEDTVFAMLMVEPPEYGNLDGTVTEIGTTVPIDSVLVTATPAKVSTYTNSTGYYIFEELGIGTYNVTFEKEGYNVGHVDSVEIFEDDITTVNYAMTSPILTFDPTSFTFQTASGGSVVDTLYVENIGTGPVDFDIDIDYIYDKSRQSILCVDRDGSYDVSYTDDWPYFQAALDAVGYAYTYYEVTDLTQDGPDLATMQLYDVIIWFSGEVWGYFGHDCMTDNDEINLAAYLDGGGTLFLSAQDYFWASYSSAGDFSEGQFPYDYLGMRSVSQDNWLIGTSQGGPPTGTIEGVAGSLAEGYTFDVQDIYSAKEGLYIDWLTDFVADSLFNVTSPTPEGICGIQYDAMTFRTVFTSASFAAITNTTVQTDLIDDIILWLGSGIPPWLTVVPDDGTIDPSTTAPLTVTADAEELEVGDYYATITVNTENPDIGQTIIDVHLEVTVSVEEIHILSTKLNSNFPNPFSNSTTISFSLKEKSHVKLSVYNIKGQLVATLIDDMMNPVANYEILWNGMNGRKQLANGIYFYKLKTNNKTFLKKMILLR